MDLTDVRRHHLSLVLELLLRDGPLSRAELSRRLGLTKATTSALAVDLLDRELVEEQAARLPGRVGRPAVAVAAAASSVGALGLEINVDSVAAGIVDLAGTISVRHRRDGDYHRAGPPRVFDHLRAVADAALRDAARQQIRIVGAALAVPGLVDPVSRSLLVAPNLHWHDLDLTVRNAEAAFAVAVDSIDNEATLGALAELRHGAGRALSSFVYVSGGVGIGGGIVIDGRLVHGAHGFAGELGHVVVDSRGPRCECGARGCLEVYVGAVATASTQQAARALATALRSVVHLLDPQAVILGGRLADSDDLAPRLAALLQQETIGGRWRPVEVRRSPLGADAALLGAATTVLDTVVADPTLVTRRAAAQSA